MNFGNKPRARLQAKPARLAGPAQPEAKQPSAERKPAADAGSVKSKHSHTNQNCMKSDEQKKEYLWRLRLAMGNIAEACLAFGCSKKTVWYHRKNSPWFKAEMDQVIRTCHDVKCRTEEQMAESILHKWYSNLAGQDVSNKDMEAFINSLTGRKRTKAEEAAVGTAAPPALTIKVKESQ